MGWGTDILEEQEPAVPSGPASYGQELLDEQPEPRQGSMMHDIGEGGKQADISETITRGFVTKPDSYARWLAGQWYPDQPIEQAVKNFGVYKGKVYHTDPQSGEHQWVMDPGSSNWRNWVKRTIEAVPELAQAAMGILTAPMHLAGPAGSAAAIGSVVGTGAAVEAGRQGIGGAITGESQFNPYKVGSEGAMGIIPEVPGMTGVRAGAGRAARDIERYVAEEAAKREQRAAGHLKETGFDVETKAVLSPAESTHMGSQISRENYLATHPETADRYGNWREERDNAVVAVVDTFVNSLRKGVGNEEAARAAREAAEASLAEAKKIRSAHADQYYKEAYATSGPMDIEDVAAMLDDLIDKNKGTKFEAGFKRNRDALYNIYKDPETGEVQKVLKTDLEELNWVLLSMHSESDPSSKQYMGRIFQGKMKGIEHALKTTLEAQSPGYKAARQIYSEDSASVDRLLGGGIEAITKMKDPDLAKAARRIFSGGSFSTEEAQRVMMVLRAKDPKSADAFLGNYIDGQVMAALKETERGEVLSAPGKIRKALFGNEIKRRRVKALMTPAQYDAFADMMEFVGDTAKVPSHVGSQTYSRGEIERGIREHAGTLPGRTARTLLRGVTLNIAPRIADWWETRAFDETLVNITDVITKPSARRKLADLRKYKADDARRMVGLYFLLAGGAEAGLEQLGLNPRQMFDSKQTEKNLEPVK
jgi:hypothetical protein